MHLEPLQGIPQIPVGQTTTIPQAPYQGQYIQGQPFQPYQGSHGTIKPGIGYPFFQTPPYPGGMQVPVEPIPSYPGYPPLVVKLYPQGYQPPQMNFNRKFPFIATLESPDLSWFTNDPIHHSPW